MTTYIAFLHGINVGGHNRMTMDALRDLCASLGLADVATYIQSGNLVVSSDEHDSESLARTLESGIESEFGYDVPVQILSRDQLAATIHRQPFDAAPDDTHDVYVTFLDSPPTEDDIEILLDTDSPSEKFVVIGSDVYTLVDRTKHESGRYTDVEGILGVPGTRRKWNVVTSVFELAAEDHDR